MTFALPTPDGAFLATFSELGLARLEFPSARGASARPPGEEPANAAQRRWRHLTQHALRAALAGRPPPELPPLDLSRATPFQQSVWQAMARIAPGSCRTYGDIAREVGRPRAVRAVGQACGANPIPVLIPCLRVLAAGYGLGGFSADPAWKRRLLEREGWTITIRSSGPARVVRT